MEIGYAYKPSMKSDMVLTFILSFCLLVLAFVLSIVFQRIELYVFSGFLILLSILCLVLVLLEYGKLKRIEDVIIKYDKEEQIFIINKYGKDIRIDITDICDLEYKNKSLECLCPILYIRKNEYGKIIFYLQNNRKIVTLKVKDVVYVYDLIMDIINGFSEMMD